MSISAAMGISLSGMQAETRRISTAAHNIANAETNGYNRLTTQFSSQTNGGVSANVTPSSSATSPDGSNVDLGSEMLDVIGASQGFKANAAVFETGADMWDVLMTMVRD
ncbi:flagellar basal body protein [Rhizobium sp. XQZ8]|uniref:flagellar basal body rod protein FlgC n=1 Tax=Rhizobium populisoli TaxID=2859785 RepID=UPI001CA533DA|nr:flagellar basal body rod C-terminal domain-containing protein [Rhizobium populisoli]MBW6424698.1 flagellar basal body protein [Rhizobium populisoli]